MALIDSVLNMVNRKGKDPDAPKPPAGSRSEREAKIKDKAGLVINVFALCLALNAWYGGKLSSTIMNNTISANNQWAWYQAKNVRAAIYKTTADLVEDKKLAQHYHGEAQRMQEDMEAIKAKAQALEAEQAALSAKAPYYTYSAMLMQLGLVLSTAAILAVSMPLFYAAVAVGSSGVMLFAIALGV